MATTLGVYLKGYWLVNLKKQLPAFKSEYAAKVTTDNTRKISSVYEDIHPISETLHPSLGSGGSQKEGGIARHLISTGA